MGENSDFQSPDAVAIPTTGHGFVQSNAFTNQSGGYTFVSKKQIDKLLSQKMNKVIPTNTYDILVLSSTGNSADSGLTVAGLALTILDLGTF